jgi:hypothetical protein
MAEALRHWKQGAPGWWRDGAGPVQRRRPGLAALGDGQRPVNVFWALGSLLGLNCAVAGWAIGFATPANRAQRWAACGCG